MVKRRHSLAIWAMVLLGMAIGALNVAAQDADDANEGAETAEVAAEAAAEPAVLEPQDQAESATAPIAEDDKDIMALIDACHTLIEWYNVREGVEEISPAVQAALDAKEKALLEKSPPVPINGSLDLADFAWELSSTEGENAEEGKFTVSWLFHKKGEIKFEPGHTTQIVLRGTPDKAHVRLFTDPSHAEKGYFQFTWDLDAPMDTWATDEYYLLRRDTNKIVPNVPYRMRTSFSEIQPTEEGAWGYVGPYGERINLDGWYASLGE